MSTPESVRFGLSADALRQATLDNLTCLLARFPAVATPHDWYAALAYTVRNYGIRYEFGLFHERRHPAALRGAEQP